MKLKMPPLDAGAGGSAGLLEPEGRHAPIRANPFHFLQVRHFKYHALSGRAKAFQLALRLGVKPEVAQGLRPVSCLNLQTNNVTAGLAREQQPFATQHGDFLSIEQLHLAAQWQRCCGEKRNCRGSRGRSESEKHHQIRRFHGFTIGTLRGRCHQKSVVSLKLVPRSLSPTGPPAQALSQSTLPLPPQLT